MDRHLPKLIRLVRDHNNKNAFSLTFDGEEFPYFLLEETIRVDVGPDEMPGIRLTLIADRVEIVNDWGEVTEAEKAAI